MSEAISWLGTIIGYGLGGFGIFALVFLIGVLFIGDTADRRR